MSMIESIKEVGTDYEQQLQEAGFIALIRK
jgi:hypothetical protein